jgi:four helix bundle protein
MTGRTYQDLELWQRSMDLVVECYQATNCFPDREAYGLTSQLQRAAVCVPANIAEGHSRQHQTEFIQHLSIAYGSLAEVKTHVQIAQRLNYLPASDTRRLLDRTGEVGRFMNGLLRYLRSHRRQPKSDLRNPTA